MGGMFRIIERKINFCRGESINYPLMITLIGGCGQFCISHIIIYSETTSSWILLLLFVWVIVWIYCELSMEQKLKGYPSGEQLIYNSLISNIKSERYPTSLWHIRQSIPPAGDLFVSAALVSLFVSCHCFKSAKFSRGYRILDESPNDFPIKQNIIIFIIYMWNTLIV